MKVTESVMYKDALTSFREVFGREPEVAAFAPGRLTLFSIHNRFYSITFENTYSQGQSYWGAYGL